MSEERSRRLAAIMFTDMVGYTALMQEDESRAMTLRDRHRTVLREGIEAHGGEIVQFYGDGTLSVFPSAVQAVDAAIDVQLRFQQDPPIPVRIGLHIGDIVQDQDGVHGDGVNVAARVQGLAVPGSVLVSGGVYEELKNHPRLPTRSMGDFELKNVQTRLAIHAVAVPGLAVPSPADLSSKPALVPLRAQREKVIDALSTHFVNDALDMDEFEQRVDLAHRATSVAELDELLTDLEAAADVRPSESLVLRAEAPQVAIATRGRKAKRVLSILSGIQRKGTWSVPKRLRVVAVMGGVDLDFREAEFGPGVTEVRVMSVMGGIAIIVPPHLQVECDGLAILGHFEGMDRSAGERDPDAPLLRITGVAVMGAVEICTRPLGETMKVDPRATVGQIGRR